MEIKEEYKGKVIYAFPTMGKSHCAKLNKNIFDVDVLLKKMFQARTRKELLNNMKNASKYDYNNVIDFCRLQIRFAKEANKTVLLTNDHYMIHADKFFLPKNLNVANDRATARDGFGFKTDKLNKKYQSIQTFIKNRNKPVVFMNDNEYLSKYIFKDNDKIK